MKKYLAALVAGADAFTVTVHIRGETYPNRAVLSVEDDSLIIETASAFDETMKARIIPWASVQTIAVHLE